MQQTLGSFLKTVRKEKNITLEEASFQTKVRLQYLRALEENEITVLPSKVQGKGFLRLYAEYLGIEEKIVLSAWEEPNLIVPEKITSDQQEQVVENIMEGGREEQKSDSALLDENTPQKPEDNIAQSSPQYIHYDDIETHEEENSNETNQQEIYGSAKIFANIGETLKTARQSLHLSLDEIEKYTNIRNHYLQALENGNLENLPSPVQGRGLLNNYAKFLNLNHETLLTQFAEGLQLRREELLSPQEQKKKRGSENLPASQTILFSKKYFSLDFILTIILILGVFGIIIFAAAQIASPTDNTQASENPPSISDVLLQETEFVIENTPTLTPLSNPIAGNGNDTALEETNSENSTILPEGSLPLQVYVIAKQRVYLRITADEEVVFDGRTIPGNAYEFSAESQIILLTGNASGIDAYFNQEPVGILGDVGEVKTFVFTLEQGIITPTPRFSPTPTNTVQPTATTTSQPTLTPTIAAPTPTVTPLIP